MTRTVALAFAFAVTAGCREESEPGPPREDVIAALVADVMIPAHVELASEAAALADAADFCADEAAGDLVSVHDAWRAAHRGFGRTEAFGYGPAVDEHFDSALLFWPTRPENAEEIVAGSDPIDAAVVAGLGATSKGLPAIEAQLFDPEGGDAAVLARYQDATTGERRCTFVGLLAADAAANAEALRSAWADDGGDFGGELVRAGGSDTRYSSVKAALDEVVNGIIALLQVVDDTKLARPLGSKTGGTPQPQFVPSPYADDSVAMIRANLEGVRSLWTGKGGLGLRDMVVARKSTLADTVDDAFDAADDALLAIGPPLREAVESAPADVQRAIDRVKDLRRLFGVDVAQQLDVTVTLSDNDGD